MFSTGRHPASVSLKFSVIKLKYYDRGGGYTMWSFSSFAKGLLSHSHKGFQVRCEYPST